MPAQQLNVLNNNESIHADPCGQYALERLQEGARPADVSRELLREYLVKATVQQLAAYRRYREQSAEYVTVQKLEALQWETLYAMVSLEDSAVDLTNSNKYPIPVVISPNIRIKFI